MFFFFNDTATTEIYTLSLHDALPIYPYVTVSEAPAWEALERLAKIHPRFAHHTFRAVCGISPVPQGEKIKRSEEHTSELQSRLHLVCRLLLEKKKKGTPQHLQRIPPH